MKIPGLITLDDLTRRLDCTRRQLDRLRRQAHFPTHVMTLGRQLFWREAEVEAWIANCAKEVVS